MAAQAPRDVRLAAADVVLDNSGTPEELRDAVDRLWEDRLVPFARNIGRSPRCRPDRRAGAGGRTTRTGARQAARLSARLRRPLRRTSWPLTTSGRRRCPDWPRRTSSTCSSRSGTWTPRTGSRRSWRRPASRPGPASCCDSPKPGRPDPAAWSKRLHGNADPGRPVNVHVRVAGSPGWRFALCFRDWLTARTGAAGGVPCRKAAGGRAACGGQLTTAGYAGARNPGSRTSPAREWNGGPRAAAGSRRRTTPGASPGAGPGTRPKLNQGFLSVPGGRLDT